MLQHSSLVTVDAIATHLAPRAGPSTGLPSSTPLTPTHQRLSQHHHPAGFFPLMPSPCQTAQSPVTLAPAKYCRVMPPSQVLLPIGKRRKLTLAAQQPYKTFPDGSNKSKPRAFYLPKPLLIPLLQVRFCFVLLDRCVCRRGSYHTRYLYQVRGQQPFSSALISVDHQPAVDGTGKKPRGS